MKAEDADIAAYLILEQLRWPNGPDCPHCGWHRAHYIAPANGKTRVAGPSRVPSVRRIWRCAFCRKQFSVLIGTPMSGTKVPIRLWLRALGILAVDPDMPVRKLGAELDITPGTALRLRRKIQRGYLGHGEPIYEPIIPKGKRRNP